VLIIPAIDLLGGKCVRLLRGRYDTSRVYDEQPAEIARRFAQSGAAWLHVVDLDAARGDAARGDADNRDAIEAIRRAVPCRIEVGGGIRTAADVKRLLDLGIDRLILGTILVSAPETVSEWLRRYGGDRFAAGIDARDGSVKVKGWEKDGGHDDQEMALGLATAGLERLVYTSIGRDGTLAGPDIERTVMVAKAAGLPTLLSGGIGSEEHVEMVARERHPLVRGIITGKAIYEGKIDLARVISRFQSVVDW
jgi:phosphoribosylformimino-5-aminoimidazole carboxamide ribotide isomerase